MTLKQSTATEHGTDVQIHQVRGPAGVLHTQVYRPSRPATGTVAIRTPYSTTSHHLEASGWARHGYNCVVQDVRGRHNSEGMWQPYAHELVDAEAFAAWLQELPWVQDAPIYPVGASYGAHCALHLSHVLGSTAAPAVIVSVPALSANHVSREPSGHPRFYGHAWWWFQHGVGPHSRTTLLHDHAYACERPLQVLPPTDLHVVLADDAALSPNAFDASVYASFSNAWLVDDEVSTPSSGNRTIAAAFPWLFGTSPRNAADLLIVSGQFDVFSPDAWELQHVWPGNTTAIVGLWQHDLGLVNKSRNGVLTLDQAHRVLPGRAMTRWLQQRNNGHPSECAMAIQGSPHWRNPVESVTESVAFKPHRAQFVADPHTPHQGVLGPQDATQLLSQENNATFWHTIEQPQTICGPVTVEVSGHQIQHEDASSFVPTAIADITHTPVDLGVVLVWVRAIPPEGEPASVVIGQTMTQTTSTCRVMLPPIGALLQAGDRLVVVLTGHLYGVFARESHTGADPLRAETLQPAIRRILGPVTVHIPVATGPTNVSDHLMELLS